MRILAIADEESRYLWDFFDKSKLEGIDLILSAGDLDPRYLSFLATFTHAPVLYVHGNHDTKYDTIPPDGCICIDDDIYVYKGVRIMGLGGSMRYSGGNYQYTDKEMNARFRKLWWKRKRRGGIDILLAHAPAYQINDGRDLPHQGFQLFNQIMTKYRPRFFLHGHVHQSYSHNFKRYDKFEETHIINAYERCVFDFDDEDVGAHLF